MKFDKFMEHCFKILALVTALVVAVGAVVSCTRPFRACAVEISADEQAGINDFLDAYASNLSAIDFEFNSNADGDRNVRVQIYGRQQIAYNELFQIYDNMSFSLAPVSVTVSGSGASGVFYDNNHYMHGGTVLQGSSMSGTLFTSDLFTITYGFYANQTDLLDSSLFTCSPYSYTSGVSGYLGVQCNKNGGGSFYPYRRTFTTSSYLNIQSASFYNGSVSSANVAVPRYLDSSIPPTILPTTNVCGICAGSVYEGASGYTKILGYTENITIPESTVDTLTPWDYYNDYILPDLQDEFPGYDEFFVFPDGYYPDVEPTEPNYQTTNNVYIIPIIIGNPLPVDITDDLGNILDVLDILADLLPDGGFQIQIDGITLTFPRDGDNVVINGNKYPLPLPDFQLDGHTINLPDSVHFDFDGIPFTINSDGTITINGNTYNLPIGTPTQLTTEYDNYVYEYEIPTIEKINIVDAEISAPDLANYVDGISFMSGAMSDFIDGIGLMPFIIACLSLGAITYVIWKIGG